MVGRRSSTWSMVAPLVRAAMRRQGSQFTTPRFTDVLIEAGVKVSMDGKGRWMDNPRAFLRTGGSHALDHRAPVAVAERRVRPSQRLRNRLRGPCRDRQVDHPLQHRAAPLGSRRTNTPRSPQRRRGTQVGGARETGSSVAMPPRCPGKRDHLRSTARAARQSFSRSGTDPDRRGPCLHARSAPVRQPPALTGPGHARADGMGSGQASPLGARGSRACVLPGLAGRNAGPRFRCPSAHVVGPGETVARRPRREGTRGQPKRPLT